MEGKCKRHPKHKQSKGVCPYCLRERLNRLSSSSSYFNRNLSSSSSSSSAYSSDDESDMSTCSPSPTWRDLHRIRPMTKSRSLAFAARDKGKSKEKERKSVNDEKMKKKGRTFWSKLFIGSKREEDGALFHSKTMKERPSSSWAIFS